MGAQKAGITVYRYDHLRFCFLREHLGAPNYPDTVARALDLFFYENDLSPAFAEWMQENKIKEVKE